jgi:hypothetical protein
MCVLVIDVRRIKQRYKNIHIQERDTQSSSRN